MNNHKVDINLPIIITKEGQTFVATTPLLDLSSCSDTFEGAKKRFEEILNIFIEELIDRGTLDEVLKENGWQKINQKWTTPTVVGHENIAVRV